MGIPYDLPLGTYNEIEINKDKIPLLNKAKRNEDFLDLEDFINQMLKLHNDERKKNKSIELKLNENLNLLACEYAENLKSNQGKIKYRHFMYNIYNGLILGENIAFSETKEPKKIFDYWLNERKNYKTNNKKFSKENAHYTQIIWKNTKEIGISISHDKENKRYCTVILYYPPGNVFGGFPDNV